MPTQDASAMGVRPDFTFRLNRILFAGMKSTGRLNANDAVSPAHKFNGDPETFRFPDWRNVVGTGNMTGVQARADECDLNWHSNRIGARHHE
jgi:hypothetical protein